MKRDKYDAIISDLVRERDDWTCTRCRTYFPDRKGRDVHASHLWSRGHRAIRWEPEAIVTHCARCHDWYGKNIPEAGAWAKDFLGAGLYEILKLKANSIRKWTKPEKEEMYKHYKNELKRLKKLRAEGRTGHLKVISYD